MIHLMHICPTFPATNALMASVYCEEINKQLARSGIRLTLSTARSELGSPDDSPPTIGIVVKVLPNAASSEQMVQYYKRWSEWLRLFRQHLWGSLDAYPTLCLIEPWGDIPKLRNLDHFTLESIRDPTIVLSPGRWREISQRIEALAATIASSTMRVSPWLFAYTRPDEVFTSLLDEQEGPFYTTYPIGKLPLRVKAWVLVQLEGSEDRNALLSSEPTNKNRLLYHVCTASELSKIQMIDRDFFDLPLDDERWVRCWPIKASSSQSELIIDRKPPSAWRLIANLRRRGDADESES